MGVDVVFECTGAFRERVDLVKHIEAGARFVILSAPAKSEDVPTVIHAVNRLPRESRSDYFLCELHNKLHHACGGGHGTAHRHQEGHHDDDPCLHLFPIDCGFWRQGFSQRPGRRRQPHSRFHRSGSCDDPRATGVKREIRRRGGASAGGCGIAGGHRFRHIPQRPQ